MGTRRFKFFATIRTFFGEARDTMSTKGVSTRKNRRDFVLVIVFYAADLTDKGFHGSGTDWR